MQDRDDALLRDFHEKIGLKEGIPVEANKSISVYDIYNFTSQEIAPNRKARHMPRVPRTITPPPTLRVASLRLRENKGLLLVAVPADGGQGRPPSNVYRDITIIPILLVDHVHVLQLSPGDAKFLIRVQRVPGGTAITVPEFDASAMILCTTDQDLAKRIHEAVDRSPMTNIKK